MSKDVDECDDDGDGGAYVAAAAAAGEVVFVFVFGCVLEIPLVGAESEETLADDRYRSVRRAYMRSRDSIRCPPIRLCRCVSRRWLAWSQFPRGRGFGDRSSDPRHNGSDADPSTNNENRVREEQCCVFVIVVCMIYFLA